MASSHHFMNLHNRSLASETTSSSSVSFEGTQKQTILSKVLNSGRRNLFKYVSGLLFLGFAAQSAYLYQLEAGFVRIPNDPFDNWFGAEVSSNKPEAIWKKERQLFLRNVLPVPVHSHNDYERRIPLFEALGSGCISVEADVHLKDNDLLVGHSDANLHKHTTLRSLYLEPLRRILEGQNEATSTRRGVFSHNPDQTLVLLVDLKTSGPETFAEIDAQLQPLRDLDFLTYWDGTTRIMRPLTVVASGNADFDDVLALNATHRDIFWDAKLEKLVASDDKPDSEPPAYKFNQSNSYFASTEFRNAMLYGYPTDHGTPPTQLDQARVRGLLARYWDTPTEPPNLREVVWRVLVDAGVGVLNVDDLGAVRARARGLGSIGQGTTNRKI